MENESESINKYAVIGLIILIITVISLNIIVSFF